LQIIEFKISKIPLIIICSLFGSQVEKEMDNFPVSKDDAIRKSSKCYELESMMHTLEGILENAPKQMKGN